jgi:carboxymethylenebutenolidase
MLSIELVGGSTEAILALPPEGRGPGVLFVMDAFGLRPRIQEMAERIAGWGYVVLAPNVFYADGTVAELAAPEGTQPRWEDVAPRVARLSGAAVASDIDGYVAALRALPEVGDGPLGAVGFCMGGRVAVRAAGRHPEEIAACAAFHTGGLVTEEADSPHRGLAGARAEFLLAHADNDPSMTPAQWRCWARPWRPRAWWRRTWLCRARRTATRCRTPRPGTRQPTSGHSSS